MNIVKLMYGLGHGSFAAAAGAGLMYGFTAQGLTLTTQSVIITLSSILAGAAGLKLAGLLPDAGSKEQSAERIPENLSDPKLSLNMADRHPGVDESIRQNSGVRKAMAEYLKAHPTCAVPGCGSAAHCQVHHRWPLWAFVDQPMEVQIQHASDPDNYITLCEDETRGNHHLWWGHAGCFAERCVPNIAQVIATAEPKSRVKT